ncbi:unnamed protein product [Acanthoscelides obtectus]|uniref:GAS2-like protein pickled eggs n=1 Tax=Acanthoscelides obtectus TaxID=200917 RepID=A0A9P0MFP9_ACAOB|nr:unnamed protein product [Acanthoscelides obtectus]CAK1659474.1 GAS2-like protein pickled eggs [Acanthoscelides obtectus]
MSNSSVLLEARPFRPFRSSEEYLYAMKEDLAEWLHTMYPHLQIQVDNFMEKLETGVALCEHANAVRAQAHEYVAKKQAKKVMTRSVTGSLAIAQDLHRIPEVKYFNTAKPGTFFARDNVSNFINWCRNALKIIECLLFESDDLIMRKNEKHVILCLLEVARRGAKFGMLAPMLVQMERQIDREIAADQKKNGLIYNENTENQTKFDGDSDSELEDEETVLMYGPVPQIVTNDLKCLDDMVRDLVAQCTCPTQFPMIRVSDGKYRIGDTKVLIFVRILRNHVMVRVGGGWDTLAHYLDKHDPCRCRSQHRTTQGAKLVSKQGAQDLHGSHVYYNRVPTTCDQGVNSSSGSGAGPTMGAGTASNGSALLGPPMHSLNRSRSRSPSQLLASASAPRRSISPAPSKQPHLLQATTDRRSRSPTPNFTSTYTAKLASSAPCSSKHTPTTVHAYAVANSTPKPAKTIPQQPQQHVTTTGLLQIDVDSQVLKSETSLQVNDTDHSDSTSEMSDEGYRSLGIIQDKNKQPPSQQNSLDATENAEHQQIYTGDELNDYGLRKTQFSHIYEDDGTTAGDDKPTNKPKLEEWLYEQQHSKEVSPTTKTQSERSTNAGGGDGGCGSTAAAAAAAAAGTVKRAHSSVGVGGALRRKQRSFCTSSMPARTTETTVSAAASNRVQAATKKSTAGTGGCDSKTNTWSGRLKTTVNSSRHTLTSDTFVSPFQRNATSRRSASAVHYSRRSSSANSSPTKSRLKQELLQTVKQIDDETAIVEQVQELLKRYKSLNTLDDKEFSSSNPRKHVPEIYSPRKDSRPENHVSRIPAPLFPSKT